MNVLAIDGALGAFSTAVARDGTIVDARAAAGNVALESGLAMVAQTLKTSNVVAAQIDRIAVGCGPGGFTGLRIAISYAKSLAQAWKRPLVSIDSFDLLEYGSRLERVLTVVQGRTGVVSLRYRDGDVVRRASGYINEAIGAVLPPSASGALPVLAAPKDVLAALAERAVVVQPVEPMVTPAAAAAALAAGSRAPAASVHAVRADYGELPAAKIPKFGTRA